VFRRAVAAEPENAELHWLGGTLFAETGRLAEAETAFARAVAIAPRYGAAWHALVQCRTQTEADRPRAERLRAAIADATAPEQRVLLNFALGKLWDDLGAFAEAYATFDAANGLRAANTPLDRAAGGRLTAAIVSLFSAAMFARASAPGGEDERPVLLVGMPHSGIAQAEQILAGHPQVAIRREPGVWAAAGERMLREGESSVTDSSLRETGDAWLAAPRSAEARRLVDSQPFGFRWIGLFHRVFPRGRIIHCRRNPIEACLALFSGYSAPRPGLPSIPADLVFFYRQYLRLMQHWRGIIPADRLLEVDYEALAADREGQARRVVEFCGLDWDGSCLDEAAARGRTASRWQARRPISARTRWQDYAKWAGPFVQLLVPTGRPGRG
jgi:tetratricopeptide (TPR) repeat protein